MGDRNDSWHGAACVLFRELHLGDERRQRGSIADAEPKEHKPYQQPKRVLTARDKESSRAEDLNSEVESRRYPSIAPRREQFCERLAPKDRGKTYRAERHTSGSRSESWDK